MFYSLYFVTMLLIFGFVLLIPELVIASQPDYDEVSKFNEVIQLENPLVVLFSEECCQCTDCVEAEVLLGGMSQQLEVNLGVLVIRLKKPDLRSRFGVKQVPALAYIRKNKTALYDLNFEMDTVYSWLQENIDPLTIDLDDQNFEHLTQAATGATTGDWLILFHDGSCCKKRELIYLENAGIKLRNKVNVASVNIKNSPDTSERFNVRKCPSIIFFRHQKMYRFPLMDINTGALVRFATKFYVNSKAEKVPLPPSAFDKFTDKFIETAKYFYDEHFNVAIALFALIMLFIIILLIYMIFMPASHSKKE